MCKKLEKRHILCYNKENMSEEKTMYTQQPKKLIIINILDILRKYSDAEHRMSQKEIADILENEYFMKVDRKAIKRNLMNLIDFGYSVEYSEASRINNKGEEETIYSDWYLERDFSDAELRLIIDSLLSSKHIPAKQCKDLIEKIEGLSSKHFKSKMKHVCSLPTNVQLNHEIFFNIEILDEAIEKKVQVKFLYADFGTDKKLHPRKNSKGAESQYTVNPYQMVVANGKYYLIGNCEKYNDVSHFRIDRIKKISLTENPLKPQKKVKGLEDGLDLPKHMAEHIYMFSGKSELVTMKTSIKMAGELVDWFGDGVTFREENKEDGTVKAVVKVNIDAMRYWSLQYSPYVTILSPQSLVDTIKNDLKNASSNYEKE